MQCYHNRYKVAYTPLQMFDLVAAVEDYPQFLPLCEGLTVRSSQSLPEGKRIVIADMSVGYGPINETFTSKVTLAREDLNVLVEYLDGPFSHLENRWRFEPIEPASSATNDEKPPHCLVDFYLEYEFRSTMLQMLMGSMFETAFKKFAAAFEGRAGVVYNNSANNSQTA